LIYGFWLPLWYFQTLPWQQNVFWHTRTVSAESNTM
jgi:hypothetical protein